MYKLGNVLCKKSIEKKINILYAERIFLILIFLLVFILDLWPVRMSHGWDESVYLQHADILFEGKTNYNEFAFRPPLLPILFYMGYFFSHSAVCTHIIVAFICAMIPVFVYLIAKNIYDTKTAVVSVLLFLSCSLIYEHSHFLITDIPALSLTMISFFFLIRGGQTKNKRHFILAGFFTALAILMKFTSFLLIPIFLIYIYFEKIRIEYLKSYILSLLITLFPYFAWAQITQGFFLKPFFYAVEFVSDLNKPFYYYAINLSETYSHLCILGLVLFFIFSFVLLRVNMKTKSNEILIDLRIKTGTYFSKKDIFFIIWILSFLCLFSFAIQHKEIRYIFPITLPLLILSARGYCNISSYLKNHKYLFVFIFSLMFLISFINIAPIKDKNLNPSFINQWQSEEDIVSDYINNNLTDANCIYTNNNYPVFAYNTNIDVFALCLHPNIFFNSFPENMKKNCLFILYKNLETQPKQEWFDNSLQFKKIKEFENIILYDYIYKKKK